MRALVVICVLVVLAWWLVHPRMGGRPSQSRHVAAATQISSFTTVLDAFKVDTGFYPPTQPGLSALLSNSSASMGWKGPYLKELPKDPWGNEYYYEYPGRLNPSSYDLISGGLDGKVGSEDDISNVAGGGKK